MTALRSAFITGLAAVALGGLFAPAATAETAAREAPAGGSAIVKTWNATVQCQIVRISDNNVVGYDRGDGSGNTRDKAINNAKRNVPVPNGHYKRHCDAKRVW